MSTACTYKPESVVLEYRSTETWFTLETATITLAQTYDLSERGILTPGTDTLTMTLSRWVDQPLITLVQGTPVRLRYTQPGLDELYSGLITDISTQYTADPSATRHGSHWRADHTITTTSWAASRLARTASWETLPAETVTARLNRWDVPLFLHGVTDASLPPETSEGSTSLLEIVRAACDYLGVPVRLINNDLVTEVHAVTTSTALPTGFTDTDALDMYCRASNQTSAGDREISFATDDEAQDVSADLVADDVRILHSSWRIPDPLPAPFADPAPVSSFTLTLTPTGCTGSLVFSYATAHRLRYRPPAPYIPGHSTSSAGHGGSTGGTGDTGGSGSTGATPIGGGGKYWTTSEQRSQRLVGDSLCNFVIGGQSQWLFEATILLNCNADLDAGSYLTSLQMRSELGSLDATMTALPSQYTQTSQQHNTGGDDDLNVPGRYNNLYYTSTFGPVTIFDADGTAPANFGFHTVVRVEGYVRNGSNIDDTFKIIVGAYGGNSNVIFAQGGAILTQLTQDATTPGTGGDGGGGGGDVS